MKPRPTAEDRQIADVLRNLPCGNYSINVAPPLSGISFLGLAELKTEGQIRIDFAEKVVRITPT